ncbi:MAG: ribosome recycling factor [Chloroflexi bacterium]|nr:ribosome recycling factor [Chloroflexota bacterium]
MPAPTLEHTEERMNKTLDVLRRDLLGIRTGRASPELLHRITVPYYGSPTPLQQIATISTADARTIIVQPWDRQLVPEIERAIMKSDLGLNPSNDGEILRIILPPLTEQRRTELARVVAKRLEEARIALRNERRDAHELIRKAEKAGELSADEAKRRLDDLQKIVDRHVAEVEKIGAAKQAEIAEV